MIKQISPLKQINMTVEVPPDKSISHRGVMFGALAEGQTRVYNPLLSADVLATVDCMKKLGVQIELRDGIILVNGTNCFNDSTLYAANSGTTMRLLSGILASHSGKFTLTGDESLCQRPMNRVIEPLSKMGAVITSNGGFAPLNIEGRALKGIDYKMPVNSAQVKSAILLGGLNADGETRVTEIVKSRDHTELMLKSMGAEIDSRLNTVMLKRSRLKGIDVRVCGDISSAAFFLVLGAVQSGSRVSLTNVGVNPTRTGILKVLTDVGADFHMNNFRTEVEPVADIVIFGKSGLKPFKITANDVPSLVDEIPVIAVLACFCEGESVISGAHELKVKESNRIDTVVNALKCMGADITATDDGMIIRGNGSLKGGGRIETYGDHRIAMSMSIAGALSENGATILNAECSDVSFPNFYDLICN